jgi:hypothetical protein
MAWLTDTPSPTSGSRPPPPWGVLLDGTPPYDGELIVDSLRAELEREWAALLDAQAALLASAAKPVAGELEPSALSDTWLREPLQLALGSVDAEEARWREAALALEARWRAEMHAMTERWRAEDEARLRATLEEAGHEGRRREQLLATLASKPRRGWARLLEAAGLRRIGAMRVACAWRDTCLACQSAGAAPGVAPGSSCAAGRPSTAAGVGAPPLHSSSSSSSSCRLGGGLASPILRASWLSALVWTLQREAAAARAEAQAARVTAAAGRTRKSDVGVAVNVAVNGEGVTGDSEDDVAAADLEEDEEEEAEAAEAGAAVNGGGPAWEGDVGDAISEALERAYAAHITHALHVEQATTPMQATHLTGGGSGGNSSRRVSGVGVGVGGVGGVGGGVVVGGGGVGEAEAVAVGFPHGAALCLLLMLIGDASAEERLAALTEHWILADETLPGLLPHRRMHRIVTDETLPGPLPHRRRPRDAGDVGEPPLTYMEQLHLLSHVRAAATMAVVAAASLAHKGTRMAREPASPTGGARGGAYLSPQALLSPPPPPPPLTPSPSDAGSSRSSSSVIQYVGSGSGFATAAAQAAAALASSITMDAQDDASAHALIAAEATAELLQILSQRPDTWAVSPPGVRQFLLWLAATEAAVGEVLAGGTELASAIGAASGAPQPHAPENGEWTLLGHAARVLREQVTPLLAGTVAEFVGPYVHAGLT